MTQALIWAILILCVGLMLLVAELFIPSGGVLGVLSAVALVGSILIAYTQVGTRAGTVFLLIVLVALPTVVCVGMSYWERTPFGRRLVLMRPTREEIDPASERERRLGELVGQIGRTVTPLRPAGMTNFDGRRVDTIAEGMMIDADTLVRVIEVRGHRVVVRKVESDPSDA